MQLKELDKMVLDFKELKAKHAAIKVETAKIYSELKGVEHKILQALQENNKIKYDVQGVGGITLVEKFSVQTPKSAIEKKDFFDYLKSEGGEDLFYTYASVNSRSLNSFYNQVMEDKPGEIIPGIGAPIGMQSLRFKNG